VLTEKVTLVVETDRDVQAGMLMFFPVYAPGPTPGTVTERRARLRGFVVGALRMADLMEGVVGQVRSDVALTLYDGDRALPAGLLFRSVSSSPAAARSAARIERTGQIRVRNRTWTLSLEALPRFEAAFERQQPRTILVSGFAVSILAFASLFLLATGQRRAALLARQMAEAAQARERRFTELARHAPVGIFITDAAGDYLFVNERWSELAGLSSEQALRRGWTRALDAQDRSRVLHAWAAALAAEMPFELEFRFRCTRDRSVYVASLAIPERDRNGDLIGYIGTCMDVTARREAELELQRANEALEGRVRERTGLLEHSNAQLQGIVRALEMRGESRAALTELSNLLGICNGLSEGLLAMGRALPAIFPDASGALYWFDQGGAEARVVASWGERAPRARLVARDECWALRRSQLHHAAPGEDLLVCEHLDALPDWGYTCAPLTTRGQLLGLLFHLPDHGDTGPGAEPIAPQDTEGRQWVASVAEHLALALANLMLRETLEAQARDDALTGLFNRRYMEEALEREVRRAERSRRPMGVIMIDLDHFKRYNDAFGHETGDRLLVALAAFLKSQVRAGDIVCRYGGEEFLVILPEAALSLVVQRAEQLRRAVAGFSVDADAGQLTNVTLSIGVAVYPAHGLNAAALVRSADAALYRAKRLGRNRVEVGALEGRVEAARELH
jgi:diguanylate cyclase (GGDEF)-like protein/PAS domain S-box-containing protein